MKKTAIILGATGLTGNLLLHRLLDDPDFVKIKLFSRSAVEIDSEKIEEHLVDLLKLENQIDAFSGDVVFCCIGTTKAKTPNKDLYRKIDYGIPVTAAKLAKQNGIPKFIVISSLGADADSRIFYSKTKGQMEQDVLKEALPETYILRPSLILGDRNESRLGEKIGSILLKTFNFIIPKKYRAISADSIAGAMHKLSKIHYKNTFIPSNEIKKMQI
ncbi:MAG TPA: NAD(P)H-binding protein [Flavobacteriaceae bacterium]|nr:NAD(P)H-binding protein [Flavobacteriaceae bacterium]